MSSCSTPLFLCTFLLSCYILIVPGQSASSDKYIDSSQKLDTRGDGISGAGNNIRSLGSHRNLRSVYGFGPRMMQISRSKIPIELDLLIDNETNDNERTKRFDDYGHMRFGKRGGEDQFDDYGHMRFGR